MGTVLANMMYSSSLLVVRLSRRQRYLSKSVNPIPWAMAATTAYAWLIYGAMVGDIFIITASFCGSFATLISLTSAIALLGASREAQEWKYIGYMEGILMFSVAVWLCIIYTITATGDSLLGVLIVGYYAVACSILMHSSNIFALISVFTLRDASAVYLPQSIASGLNSACWVIYGFFAVNSPTVYVPSMVGVLMNLIMVSCKIIFPSKLSSELALLEKAVPGDESESVETGSAHSKSRKGRAYSNASRSRKDSSVSKKSDDSVYIGRIAESSKEVSRQQRSIRRRKMSQASDNQEVPRFRGNSVFSRQAADMQLQVVGQSDNAQDGSEPIQRGRAATIKAIIASDAPPTLTEIIGKTIDQTLERVRLRAESVLLTVEDTIINNMAPILREEVLEAAVNLEELHTIEEEEDAGQELDPMVSAPNDGDGTTVSLIYSSSSPKPAANAAGSGLHPIREEEDFGADANTERDAEGSDSARV